MIGKDFVRVACVLLIGVVATVGIAVRATAALQAAPSAERTIDSEDAMLIVENDELGVCEIVAAGDAAANAGQCRKCKDRPWCGCTYTHQGRVLQRTTCDPCCYWDYWLQLEVCLD